MTLGKIWYDIRLKNLIKVGFYSLRFWIDFHSFLTQLRMHVFVLFTFSIKPFHFWFPGIFTFEMQMLYAINKLYS